MTLVSNCGLERWNSIVHWPIYRDPGVNRVLREVMRNYLVGEGPVRYSITDTLARQVTRPTLVYWGEKNRPGSEVGQRLASMIPGARYHCASNTGHWAQFEHYEEHNRAVLDFLRLALTKSMVAAKRMGDPKEFGAICAFLCSALAGYISGQNIHVDGGSYPALI